MLHRSVTVLGSTGSVGVSTLDLLGRARASGAAEVEVEALTAGRNVALLAEQARTLALNDANESSTALAQATSHPPGAVTRAASATSSG